MAAKRRPGLRFKLGDTEQIIKIGDDIQVVICKEAGQIVHYTEAPDDVKIVVESLDDEKTDLQKVRQL